MKGAEINRLVRFVKLAKNDIVEIPMRTSMRMADATHTYQIEIKKKNGGLLLGMRNPKKCIILEDIAKIPIKDTDELKVMMKQSRLIFDYQDEKREGDSFDIEMLDFTENYSVKVKQPIGYRMKIDSRKLRDAILSMKKVAGKCSEYEGYRTMKNHITFDVWDKSVTASCEAGMVKMTRKLGNVKEARRQRVSVQLMVLFDLVNLMQGEVVAEFCTGYPVKFSWSDDLFEYRILLAPCSTECDAFDLESEGVES